MRNHQINVGEWHRMKKVNVYWIQLQKPLSNRLHFLCVHTKLRTMRNEKTETNLSRHRDHNVTSLDRIPFDPSLQCWTCTWNKKKSLCSDMTRHTTLSSWGQRGSHGRQCLKAFSFVSVFSFVIVTWKNYVGNVYAKTAWICLGDLKISSIADRISIDHKTSMDK